MKLFPDWYIAQHIGVTLSEQENADLTKCFELIIDNNLKQPCALVHRDYHSRNLMQCPAPHNPGILDFQDAVWGPITYDVASLLRDAYVQLEEDVQLDYGIRYWEMARQAGLPVHDDFGTFWRDVEWMGLQRHLKVLGIFARLSKRDGKHGYLKDLPLVWTYAHRVASRYQGLGPLALLLERLAGSRRETVFA
jgi:N-acetylmuramate 1-kinase